MAWNGGMVGFYLVVAFVQIGLFGLLAARPPRKEWVWAVAGLFLCNGLGAIAMALMAGGGRLHDLAREVLFRYTDFAVFFLLAYLALVYPRRLRVLEGRRWARWALPSVLAAGFLGLVALTVAAGPSLEHARTPGFPLNVGRLLVGYAMPAAVWSLLIARWTLRWRDPLLPSERRQSMFLFAAFATRAAHILLVTFPVGDKPGPQWMWVAAQTLNAIPLLLVFACLAALALFQSRQSGATRRQTWFVLSFVGVGLLEGIFVALSGGIGLFFLSPLAHLDVFVLRPVLLWFALPEATGARARVVDARVGQAMVGLLAFAFLFVSLRQALSWGLPTPLVLTLAVALSALAAFGLALAAQPWMAKTGLAGHGPDPPDEWRPGQVLAERYRVEAFLGEGSCGETFLAHDLGERRRVVLKRTRALDARARRALLHEASAMAQVRGADAHVVRLLATETVGRETILVMEHMPGGSLEGLLAARRRLPAAEAVALTRDLLRALAAVHGAGIVHRDVKPSNVLLDAAGRARLADFGLARLAPSAVALGDPTQAVSPGTLRYMAPEQVLGHEADARSDLYAAAAMLYEMVAGTPVVGQEATDYDARRAIVEGDAPRVPAHVPPDLGRVLRRGLAKQPARRYASAAAFSAALAAVTLPGTPARTAPRRSRRRLPAGAAAPSGAEPS